MDRIHSLRSIGHGGLNASRVDHQHPAFLEPKETQAPGGAKFSSRQVGTKQLVQEPRLAFRVSCDSKQEKGFWYQT